MAKQLLISDDEESFLTEALSMALKGTRVSDALYGPQPETVAQRATVTGLLRKLGVPVVEDAEPLPSLPDMFPAGPGMDMARVQDQLKTTFSSMMPTLREIHPSRIERIAGPLFARLYADTIDSGDDHPMMGHDLAKDAIEAARDFFAELDATEAGPL